MDPKPLTSSQVRYLRGLCHHLKPVVMVGNQGITSTLVSELDQSLDHHELVKVKLSGDNRADCRQQAAQLAEATSSQVVQQIGHTASLYRRNPQQPQLALPR